MKKLERFISRWGIYLSKCSKICDSLRSTFFMYALNDLEFRKDDLFVQCIVVYGFMFSNDSSSKREIRRINSASCKIDCYEKLLRDVREDSRIC